MKSTLLKVGTWATVWTCVAGVAGILNAAVYTYDFSGLSATIPDADPAGWANHQTVSDGTQGVTLPLNATIQSLVVRLDVSGGLNGDLYAYLRHETGSGTGFAVLLNRPGTGSGNPVGSTLSGFGADAGGNPFRLTDLVTDTDVHSAASPTYGGRLTGTLRLDQSGGAGSFASFSGLSVGGTWSLFFADLSGENVSTVNGWGLEITAVPEPSQWGLLSALGLLTVSVASELRKTIGRRGR
jgi:hypothetical protein